MVLGPVQDVLKVLISECFKLKRKNDLDKHQPLACAAVTGDQGTLVLFCSDTSKVQHSKSSSTDSTKDYKPFLSQGFVSLDDSSKTHSVKILRDTGAADFIVRGCTAFV